MSVKNIHDVDHTSDYNSRLHSLLGSDPKKLVRKDVFRVSPIFSEEHSYEIVNSKVSFSDVVLGKKVKADFLNLIDEYLNRDMLRSYGVDFDNILLFVGPSGCGKTLTAMALASELNKKLYLVNLSTVVSSNLGKTSHNIFRIVEEAKFDQAVVFFDEFDALAKLRTFENDHGEMKRVTSALLQIMDLLGRDVVFIAATNHIDHIDQAVLRRFKKVFHFDMPNKTLVKDYLRLLVKTTGLSASVDLLAQFSGRYKGMSYATIRDNFLAALKKYLLKRNRSSKNRLKKIEEDIFEP